MTTKTRDELWTDYCEMQALAHDMERCAARMRMVAVDSDVLATEDTKKATALACTDQIEHHAKMAREYREMANEKRIQGAA